ncbi:MAG: 4-hydroxy-tetrahydrodipicolinate synthase, partial [Pseudomonadota bacterium]
GADAGLSVTPYYNRPTQEGLYQHFKAIAEAVDFPQILYNVPKRTGCDMSTDTVKRLAEVGNITGLKDATGDLRRARQQRYDCGADFALYSGDDYTTLDFILLGGDGAISVTANIAPNAMHTMCHLALSGDRKAAENIDNKLVGLHQNLFIEASPCPTKWALQVQGLIGEGIRLPIVPLSEASQEIVRQSMQQAGVL